MGFSVELAATAVVPKRALSPVKQKKKSSYVIDRNSAHVVTWIRFHNDVYKSWWKVLATGL